MADESTAPEEGGIETETEAPVETEATEVEVVAEGEESEAPEVIEFDFAGTKYQVPTGSSVDEVAEEIQNLASNLHGDYTKKTQTLAEERKEFEATNAKIQERAAALEKLEGMTSEAFGAFSQGLQLKAEIGQYQAALADGTLWQSDPDRARLYSDTVAQKSAQLSGIQQQVAQQENAIAAARVQDAEKRMSEGREAVTSRIKDFDESALVNYATQNGIPQEQAAQWALNPTVAIMAHKAMLFDRLQAKTTQAPAKVVKPAKPAKGSGQRRKVVNLNDSKTSSKDWFKAREAQLKARR